MFYDYELCTLIKTTIENEIGQVIETFERGEKFWGDIQPTTGDFLQSFGWGEDCKSNLTLFTDESLNIGDYVDYKGYYKVEKRIEWDYFIYSLKKVDLLG